MMGTKAKQLSHIYLQTGTKYYGMDQGPKVGYTTPVKEGHPRMKQPMFYYGLEDMLASFCQNSKNKTTWTVLRPPGVIGYSTSTKMNFATSLAVYALILKEMGKPLVFPYTKEAFHALREFVDVQLLCQAIEHVSTSPACVNQAFNITNGDFERMENIWQKIGSYFGMEATLAEKPFDMVQFMKDKETVWQRIVEREGLEKTKLSEITTFDFLQTQMQREFDEMSNISKISEYGFRKTVDTDDCLLGFFESLRCRNIIPGMKATSAK